MGRFLVVLIIDDDEDDRCMFCEAVSEMSKSFNCITASTGHEALEFLDKATELPDFIFLDLNMPRMNGKQCLEKLKSNSRLSSIPVTIYSTSKFDKDKEETKAAGAEHFLTKPNSLEQLKRELNMIFGEKIEIDAAATNGFKKGA